MNHTKTHLLIAIAIIVPISLFATVRSLTSPEASKARFEREITKREAIAQGKIQAVESYLLELQDFADKEYKLCEEPSEIFKRIEEAIYEPKAEPQEEPKIEQAKIIEEKPYIPSFEEEQKKKVVSRAVEFMGPFESMSLWNGTATTSTAYWDYKQWSIGYGTGSYKGEVITEEEARRRFYETTAVWFDRVYSQLPGLTEDQYVALTSFAYNCPAGFRDVVKRGLDKHQFWCKTAGGKVLRGLVNRRNAEAKLLFNH